MEFNASSSGRSSTKKFKSDEIRLLSLKRKHEQWVDQNIKISQSLKSVDSTSFASNRIVFSDSESSDDERHQVASRQEKSNHSGERLSGLQLFDSDEDMNMDGDVHQAENIVNRHIGWKGAKLMHMEMNFSNDKRFRLDERFLDDEIQAETKEVKDEFEPWNDENSDKKGRSGSEMEELDSTLNGGANRGKSAPFSRFDPEDEDHQRWVQSRMKKACHKKNKKDIRNVDRNVKEKDDMLSYPVSHEQYYDIDTDFLESLRKGTSSKSESFSFLRDVIGTNVVSSHTPSVSAKGIIEIRTSTDQETVSAAPSALISIADVQRRPFFIVETAEEISEAVGNFYCKKSMAIIVKRWKLIRPKIVKFYKNQRRQAVKRNRKGMDMEFHKQFLYKSPNRGPFRSSNGLGEKSEDTLASFGKQNGQMKRKSTDLHN